MSNLFAYGTLMCPDIMLRVAGGLPHSAGGVLYGYSRHPVRGERYPAIIVNPGCSVDGIIYQDLPDDAWEALDRFEDVQYERLPVVVTAATGLSFDAFVYCWRPSAQALLDPGEWNFDEFLRSGKEAFLNGYSGFSSTP